MLCFEKRSTNTKRKQRSKFKKVAGVPETNKKEQNFPLLYKNCENSSKCITFPTHNKTYNKNCATSEDSVQLANLRRLIRVFADRMCLLQPPGNPKRDKRESLSYWIDVQSNLSLWWSHRSYCRLFVVRWLISDIIIKRFIAYTLHLKTEFRLCCSCVAWGTLHFAFIFILYF